MRAGMRCMERVKGRGVDPDTLQVCVAEIYPADGSPPPGVESDGPLTRGVD
jgi:hypothetical protein